MNKLLITDIDGTITHLAHRLDPAVIEKLEHLYQKGWQLFFLTGRYFTYADQLFKDLSVPYLLGCQNGACVWSSEKQEYLYFQEISREVLYHLQECLQGFDVVFAIESGARNQDFYYRLSHCPSAQEFLSHLDPVYFPNKEDRERLVEMQTPLDDYPFEKFAVAKIFGKKSELEELQKKIHQIPEIVSNLNITLMRWPFDFEYGILFMTEKSVSKGYAVDRIVDLVYQGKKPFIMASGDDANDVSLLERGDFKIVMNSSPKSMHDLADFLAPHAKELGILSAWKAGEEHYQRINS